MIRFIYFQYCTPILLRWFTFLAQVLPGNGINIVTIEWFSKCLPLARNDYDDWAMGTFFPSLYVRFPDRGWIGDSLNELSEQTHESFKGGPKRVGRILWAGSAMKSHAWKFKFYRFISSDSYWPDTTVLRGSQILIQDQLKPPAANAEAEWWFSTFYWKGWWVLERSYGEPLRFS